MINNVENVLGNMDKRVNMLIKKTLKVKHHKEMKRYIFRKGQLIHICN